jgi:hypothetical protein
MNWSEHHKISEQLAEAAHEAVRNGHAVKAAELFAEAAREETNALTLLTREKPRTYGIIAVSAVALWYKSGELERAEKLAYSASAVPFIPEFAADQLRSLLQTIWNQQAQREAGISFAAGQVIVSVRGGEVVRGGAPLELIVDKAQAVQSLFYRVVEYVKGDPLRKKGPPSRELQERCRPWIFQSVPGSYQFSVAIQKPAQHDLFGDPYPAPEEITSKFLEVLKAASESPDQALQNVVVKPDYRETFLKMTRNIAPSGKTFAEMEIRSAGDEGSVVLLPSARKAISDSLRAKKPPAAKPEEEVVLKGTLRALDLDRDWLEITVEGQHTRVTGVGETVDDVIGPMVNHEVTVRAVRRRSNLVFIDIEKDE